MISTTVEPVLDTGVSLPAVTSSSKKSREMDDEKVQNIVKGLLRDAKNFIENEVSPDRATATKFYRGDPFGDEEEGRSSVVITVVRDTINAIIPGLIRAFYGPEKMAEFTARRPDKVEIGEQATDYCEYVFKQDNDGFLVGLSALKDAFIKRMGVAKVWWEDTSVEDQYEATGLTQEQLAALQQDPLLTISKIVGQEQSADSDADNDTDKDEQADPDAPQEQQGPTVLYSCNIVQRRPSGRVRVEAVPPEEFLFNRTARSLDEALIVGQHQELRVSDLVEMGYDYDEIIEASTEGEDELRLNPEAQARNTYTVNPVASQDDVDDDPAVRRVDYYEAYIYLDVDGDGIAELRKICAVGPAQKVMRNEPATHRPYALCLCDPEPHTLLGSSLADRTMDLQRIASAVARGTLDSLNLTIHQRMEVVDGQVSMADLLNGEIGGIIRVNQPGMLREIKHSFVGSDTLPFLQYLDEIKENRTGISKASSGLNPDALQSSTRAAVAATVSAAQQQIEMLARVAAETFFKRVYWLIYKELCQHQDHARMVRLRGGFVEIDPRTWEDVELDLVLHMPMALSMTEDKLNALKDIIERQQAYMQTLGPSNPLVNLSQLSYSVAKYTELAGFPDSSRFFNVVSPQQAQQLAQMQQQNPPPPDPNMLLAQVEQQRAQADIQLKQQQAAQQAAQAQAEQARKEREMMLEDARERMKMALDFQAKIQSAALMAKVQVNQQMIDADLQRTEQVIDAHLGAYETTLGHAADLHDSNVQAAAQIATAPTDSGSDE